MTPAIKPIDLPMPPSVNRIWRARTGHGGKPSFYIDTRYATWKRAADNLAMGQKPLPKIKGAFRVRVVLDESRRRSNIDADNRLKAVLDWLQRVEIVENDSKAEKVTVEWGTAPEGCRVFLSSPRKQQAALALGEAA